MTNIKRIHKTIESAAEAAYDRFYEITPDMSDLGYAFTDEQTKRAWREVVLEVMREVSSHE